MTDNQATEPDTLLGTTLAGTYILDKVLGEGGMGRVYLARHTRITAKRFAIKVLSEEFAQHEEALGRFKREAEAASMISSPNVVGVHDYGRTPDGRPFLVSDFLIGEELADRVERLGHLPVGEAVRIIRQVCAGLAVAHANGVTHRDVKPDNVFLVGADEELNAKLLDFGISRFQGGGGKALTQVGTALGTPDYMSPEQAKGKTVDHRADIYGVGVLLYVTLTGVMPFERDTPHATLLALLTEEAPSPRLIEPSIPEDLERIIQKAMAKDAADRYPWIAQLSQDLAPYDPTHVATAAAQPQVAQPQPAQPQLVQPQPAQPQLVQPQLVQPQAAPSQTAPMTPLAVAMGGGAQEPGSARAWIIAAFALGAPALFLALLLSVGGLLLTADVDVELNEWIVIALVLLCALGPPIGLAIRHVARNAWGDPMRTAAMGRTVRGALVAAGCTYALASLALRLAQPIFDEASWPLGDTVLAAFAVVAGLLALLIGRGRSG